MSVRIMIAEDEEIMRITVADHLRSEGWRVDEVSGGNEALALLQKQSYDIIVSDIRMPGMDGEKLLTAVKQQSPATEVIMMTAHGSTDHAVACLKQGAADYILKPFDLDDLSCRIQRIVRIQEIKARCVSLESNGRPAPAAARFQRPHAANAQPDQPGVPDRLDGPDPGGKRHR